MISLGLGRSLWPPARIPVCLATTVAVMMFVRLVWGGRWVVLPRVSSTRTGYGMFVPWRRREERICARDVSNGFRACRTWWLGLLMISSASGESRIGVIGIPVAGGPATVGALVALCAKEINALYREVPGVRIHLRPAPCRGGDRRECLWGAFSARR